MPYEEFADGGIFGPLGLTDVTPHGIAVGPLDATPYNTDRDGNPVGSRSGRHRARRYDRGIDDMDTVGRV